MTVDVLTAAAQRCGVVVGRRLTGGGSGAVSAFGRGHDGRPVVLKAVTRSSDVVDGHDLAAFRAKQVQVALLERIAPAVAKRYPAVVCQVHEPDWSAVVYEYVGWPSLVDIGLEPGAAPQPIVRRIWDRLWSDGYGIDIQPAPADLWPAVYLDRIPRRRWLLEPVVPAAVLSAAAITVNGRTVPGLDLLCARARGLDDRFCGSRVTVPVHGDLNLRNLLVDPDSEDFALIDPRGALAPWDPCYDLAKMLFTLSLFEACMTVGFTVAEPSPGEFTVGMAGPNPLAAFLSAFWADAADLAGPEWPSRLLLAHATHVVAEAACRLSDRAAPEPVRHNRCMGLLLYGMLLLADLVDRRCDVDPDAHLSLFAPATAAPRGPGERIGR